MAVILDTSFLFALCSTDDKNHSRAIELNNELNTGRFGISLYTDYIITETLTLLRKRKVNEDDLNIFGKTLISEKEKIIISNEELLKSALIIFQKYKKLSFVDAAIIATARIYNIQKIYSFDSDLDGIKDIQRVF